MSSFYSLGVGRFSSIHLRVCRGMTTIFPSSIFSSFPSLSIKRPLSGLAGHGRRLEAETVITAAKNVMPNNEETNVRPWVTFKTLKVILCLDFRKLRKIQ
jgi:hypothetical protein